MSSKVENKTQNNEIPKPLREKTSLSSNGTNTSNNNNNSVSNNNSSNAVNTSIDNRFGTKSRNMFFIRHTAHPRHLRFVTGVGGIQICAMKEDNFALPDSVMESIRTSTLGVVQKTLEPYISDPKYALKFDSSSYHQELLKKYEPKVVAKNRRERVLPPIRHWTSTYMIADDTKRWRLELNSLAKKIGIMTNEELETNNNKSKIDVLDPKNLKSIDFENLNIKKSGVSQQRKRIVPNEENSKEEIRAKTGRFNETGLNKKSITRGNTTPSNMLKGKFILCIEEAEREMWLLQVLCQILNTESLQEIQSWLVSSGFQEKEAMKELIQKALEGLNQSGRIDLDNEKQSQVDFDQVNSSINNLIDIQKSSQVSFLNNSSSSIQNNTLESKSEDFNQNENYLGKIKFNIESKNQQQQHLVVQDQKEPKEIKVPKDIKEKKELKEGSKEQKEKKEQNDPKEMKELKELKEPKELKKIKEQNRKQKELIEAKENKEQKEFETVENSDTEKNSKSHSLATIDRYKLEKNKALSTFEAYLSKSTYFQSKSKNSSEFSIPSIRPFTSKDNEQEQSLSATFNPISKNFLNRYHRIDLNDFKSSSFYTRSEAGESDITEAKFTAIKKQKSFHKLDDFQSNVKLKLETNKDSQVLTIEDNFLDACFF